VSESRTEKSELLMIVIILGLSSSGHLRNCPPTTRGDVGINPLLGIFQSVDTIAA